MSVAEVGPFGVSPQAESEFERTPPQDVAAEMCVLGGMLLSKDAIADVVETLRATDFYRPAHASIYDVICDLYGRGEPADAVTVAAELTKRGEIARVGGAPYIHTLISSVPTAANAGYYAQIVAERAILRRLVTAGTRIVQMGYGGDSGDVDDIVDRAQAEVYEVTERRTSEDYMSLEQILPHTMDELDAISNRGGQMVGVPTGFRDMDELTNGLHAGQLIVVAARPAVGKALALDTPLPTPNGWTTIGEVQVGDMLIGADGRPTSVTRVTDTLRDRPCYEVCFSDGSVIVADAEHLWFTETRASRKSAQAAAVGYNRSRNQRIFGSAKTTAEIADTLRCNTADARLNHSVPLALPLDLPETELTIHPYVLGVWLGDGHKNGARITTDDPEIASNIEATGLIAKRGVGRTYNLHLPREAADESWDPRECAVCGVVYTPKTRDVQTCGQSCGARLRSQGGRRVLPTCDDCGAVTSGSGRFCARCRTSAHTVVGQLRSLGVLNNKHIPPQYLRASHEQRRQLLMGLMDTDGSVKRTGESVSLDLTCKRLSDDARELILSLGYRVTGTTRRVKGRTEASSTCYRLNFSPQEPVFSLTRKAVLHRPTGTPVVRQRFITQVRPVDSVPVRCLQVDNASHLFLAGRSMIPTHNSTWSLDLARSASIKNGLASCIFSLEMGRNEITMRLLSAEARVPLHHMRAGTMSDDDWARLARRMGEVAEAPLFIDDSPNLTMMEIRAKARRLKQRHDLKLVIVDYLQLMSSQKRVESRQVEVSEMSRSLKLLAKELDVPVVAVSQLNRQPEQRADKKPQLSDLRESGSIEQDADMVVLLHREDLYEKESPRAGEADLIVAKNRNGPTRTVTVAFQGHYSRFVDMQRS